MKTNLLRISMIFSSFLVAQAAAAMVEAEYLAASSEGRFGGHSLGLHIDPLPIPASLGVSFMTDPEAEDLASQVTEAAAVELRVWAPMGIFGFIPYGRLGYTVAGRALVRSSEAVTVAGTTQVDVGLAETKDVKGYLGALGLAYSPFAFTSILLEAGQQRYTLAFDESAAGGLQQVESSKWQYRAGISVGI